MRESKKNSPQPIDSFVKYFNDVKPYHTKLLEVVERYKYSESIAVGISDVMHADITYRNDPLCKAVGFGLVFDECGFSNDNCCDLFQCLGGYGIVWDNSDLVAEYLISEINVNQELVIDGNHTFDRRLEILSIGADHLVLRGDQTSLFEDQKLFLIAPFNVYTIISASEESVDVYGDVSAELNAKKEFRISGSERSDGRYPVSEATYSQIENVTNIKIAGNRSITGGMGGAYIETESSPFNQGFYAVKSVELSGGNTLVRVSDETRFKVESTSNNGSVQLRTGVTAPRQVWLDRDSASPDASREYRIADSYYNVTTGKTHIVLSELLERDDYTHIRMYGYMTSSGFDNNEECDRPKPTNLHAVVSEKLVMRITIHEPETPPIVHFVMYVTNGVTDISIVDE